MNAMHEEDMELEETTEESKHDEQTKTRKFTLSTRHETSNNGNRAPTLFGPTADPENNEHYLGEGTSFTTTGKQKRGRDIFSFPATPEGHAYRLECFFHPNNTDPQGHKIAYPNFINSTEPEMESITDEAWYGHAVTIGARLPHTWTHTTFTNNPSKGGKGERMAKGEASTRNNSNPGDQIQYEREAGSNEVQKKLIDWAISNELTAITPVLRKHRKEQTQRSKYNTLHPQHTHIMILPGHSYNPPISRTHPLSTRTPIPPRYPYAAHAIPLLGPLLIPTIPLSGPSTRGSPFQSRETLWDIIYLYHHDLVGDKEMHSQQLALLETLSFGPDLPLIAHTIKIYPAGNKTPYRTCDCYPATECIEAGACTNTPNLDQPYVRCRLTLIPNLADAINSDIPRPARNRQLRIPQLTREDAKSLNDAWLLFQDKVPDTHKHMLNGLYFHATVFSPPGDQQPVSAITIIYSHLSIIENKIIKKSIERITERGRGDGSIYTSHNDSPPCVSKSLNRL
jgi:hypothetical protein